MESDIVTHKFVQTLQSFKNKPEMGQNCTFFPTIKYFCNFQNCRTLNGNYVIDVGKALYGQFPELECELVVEIHLPAVPEARKLV